MQIVDVVHSTDVAEYLVYMQIEATIVHVHIYVPTLWEVVVNTCISSSFSVCVSTRSIDHSQELHKSHVLAKKMSLVWISKA